MAMKTISQIILLAALLCSIGATAQTELPGGQVEVIRNFDARLLETDPVRIRPVLPPLDTATRRMTYNILSRSFEVEYLPPTIRPLAIRTDKNTKNYNGYTKLGGGFPSALYGELSYNLFAEDQYRFGIDVLHHSANNTRNIENQRFSSTKFGANGTYYLDQGFAVDARLGYSVDNVFFYGYNRFNDERGTDNSFAKEDVQQRFSIFDVSAKLFNGQRTQADFNYFAGFDVYLMQDNYAARENGFDLKFGASKWFNEMHELKAQIRTDFTSYRDTATQSLNNFFFEPSFTFHGDVFKAKIGAIIASHEDDFQFFPDVELSASMLGSVLTAFVGAEGTLQKNTFRSLSTYNPFIESRIQVGNTRFVEYFGGIRGNFQGINYRAQVGYKNADNLALFLTNQDTVPRFGVVYDTARIFRIHGSLIFPITKGLDLTGSVTQNFFSLDREEKPWHLPSLTINGGARYTTMEGKLLVKGDVFLENGVPYRDENGQAKNLNALFDVSLGADYLFTDNIGAFVQVNNLANNRRQRWQYYPMFGLNAFIGVTARF